MSSQGTPKLTWGGVVSGAWKFGII
jgi:hypothetical protein